MPISTVKRVAMVGIHRVEVRQGLRQILGNVIEERAALRDVQQLHAAADAHHRHPPLGDEVHQLAVEGFAAGVQQPHRRMNHVAVEPRVEIGSADQHHAVELIEHAGDVVVFDQRGNDDRNRPRLDESVEISGGNVRISG